MKFIIKDPAKWSARRVGGVWLTGEEGQKLADEIEDVEYQPTCYLTVMLEFPEQGIQVQGIAQAANTHDALKAIYTFKSREVTE